MTIKEKIARRIEEIVLGIEHEKYKVQRVEIEKPEAMHVLNETSPVVQLFGVEKSFHHENSNSRSVWSLIVRVLLREAEHFHQVDLWEIQKLITDALFEKPNLGLAEVSRISFIDEVESEARGIRTSDLGINIHFKERLR